MTDTAQASYTTWQDQGENIGIQCTVCTRTHWTGNEPPTDPQTGDPCNNCKTIKELSIRDKEQKVHDTHSEKDTCTHIYSQPKQPGVNYGNE